MNKRFCVNFYNQRDVFFLSIFGLLHHCLFFCCCHFFFKELLEFNDTKHITHWSNFRVLEFLRFHKNGKTGTEAQSQFNPQTFKAYETESYKYCIMIARSNTKILKTHRSMNKMLCLSALLGLLQLVLPSPFSAAEFFLFLDTVLRKITQNFKQFRFLVLKWFSPG